jgi:hypothetical protein
MAKKEGVTKGGKGKGRKSKRMKKKLSKEKMLQEFGPSATYVACPKCLEYDLLCVVDYGPDNIDSYARNKLFVKCPVCGFAKPREDNYGEEWWIQYHLPGIRKRYEHITERRVPEKDDQYKFTGINTG